MACAATQPPSVGKKLGHRHTERPCDPLQNVDARVVIRRLDLADLDLMQAGGGREFFLAPVARKTQTPDIPRQNAPRGMTFLRAHPLGWTIKFYPYPYTIGSKHAN